MSDPSKPPLSVHLTAEIAPDYCAVLDGRQIAQEMLWRTLTVLAPYVGGCQHCAAEMLTVLARKTVARARRETMGAAIVLIAEEPNNETEVKHRLHLEITKYWTRGLLSRSACPHEEQAGRYGERRPEPADADQPSPG